MSDKKPKTRIKARKEWLMRAPVPTTSVLAVGHDIGPRFNVDDVVAYEIGGAAIRARVLEVRTAAGNVRVEELSDEPGREPRRYELPAEYLTRVPDAA